MDTKIVTQIDALNQQRTANPLDAGIASRWCKLAIDLGQYDKALVCATQFYNRSTQPLSRLRWQRMRALALFRSLALEDALAAYSDCLNLLCDVGDSGQLPRPQPARLRVQNNQVAFESGAAQELMWATCNAMAAVGYAAFPFAGTLLGLVREGQLLPFDKDIDLGIWVEQHASCSEWLQRQGWQRVTQMLPFAHFHALVDPRTQLTLDLVGLRRLSPAEGVLGGFFLPGRSEQYQSARLLPWFDIEQRPSPAGHCWHIQAPDTILQALYGDWRTPNPWWDGMVSNVCITANTLLWRCFGYNRLIARWAAGEPERAWAYAHQILLRDPADLGAGRAKQCLTTLLQRIHPAALQWPPVTTRSVLKAPT